MARRRRRRQEIPEEERLQTVRIERIVAGGRGLARLPDGRALMAAFAAPGELVEVEVERIHKDYVEGVVTNVLEPSRSRVEARCSLFGDCGGCQLQHLEYPAQLAAKEGVVREQLARIGGLPDAPVNPVVGADDPWGYRNHMRFSTGRKFGDAGFIHRRGRRLLKVNKCPIADPWVNAVLPRLQGHARGIHQIQLRRNASTESTLVAPALDILPDESGQDHYVEELAGRRFQVSASSFFQVNSAQAEKLVQLVASELPKQGRLLIDAYAGVGTFAAIFSGRFERIIAIEESPSALRDAEVNLDGIENVEFRRAKVEELLPGLEEEPDIVLLDPPRVGCAPEVLEALVAFAPPTIVYVSCNPTTLARDLRRLTDAGYALEGVTPIDMFPQTAHIECVSRLTRPAG
jgi:23S rRNA (uracil1939-C5)-methyltransferase